ncbi:molybdate ABC transporter permease subunit [Flexistipes sinusarabici]|nr:ABC transporter permease subunit [Flexistipes sinusarabici]
MKLTTISGVFVLILALFILLIISAGFLLTDMGSIISLFKDGNFIEAVVFGLKSSLAATLFSAVLGIPSGYYLARKKSMLSRILDSLFDIPLIIPPLIVGVLLLTFFNISAVSRVIEVVFTFTGAVTAQFFISFPFTVKASKSAFEMVPPVYERIAMTLGASRFRSFYDTTFKLAFNGIMGGLILSWLRSLGEFGATLMVGGGIAGMTANIPINIYLNMTEGNFQKGLAASVLVVVFAFFCVLVLKMVFSRKVYNAEAE